MLENQDLVLKMLFWEGSVDGAVYSFIIVYSDKIFPEAIALYDRPVYYLVQDSCCFTVNIILLNISDRFGEYSMGKIVLTTKRLIWIEKNCYDFDRISTKMKIV